MNSSMPMDPFCLHINEDKKSKRAFSRANRWDIAYEQHYLCGHCNALLHPSFEVDHVVELCDGGISVFCVHHDNSVS